MSCSILEISVNIYAVLTHLRIKGKVGHIDTAEDIDDAGEIVIDRTIRVDCRPICCQSSKCSLGTEKHTTNGCLRIYGYGYYSLNGFDLGLVLHNTWPTHYLIAPAM